MQFGGSVALARLLDPSAFGIAAMLAIFTGFASNFADLNFGSAIVQRKTLDDGQLDTAFWASVAIGMMIAVLTAAAGPSLALFFAQPQLIQLAAITAVNFVFSAVGVVPRAILIRKLEIRKVVEIGFISTVAGLAVSLAMALWIRGALPLVVGPVVGQAASAVLFMARAEWIPRARFRFEDIRTLSQIGIYMTGYGILNYWSRNLDNLLIAKVFGATPLAYYVRAYTLMQLPIILITEVASTTLGSVMSRFQDDKERTRSTFLRAQRLITFVAFPTMLGLAIVAGPFVSTVYGEKWLPMVPALRVLALAGMLQGMGSPLGWIYLSQGRTDLQLLWGLISTPVFVVGILLGLSFGSITSVAIGYSFASCLLMYPGFTIPGRLIGLTLSDVIRDVIPNAVCALAMGAIVCAIMLAVSSVMPPPAVLVLCSSIGALLYGGLTFILKLPAIFDLWQIMAFKKRGK